MEQNKMINVEELEVVVCEYKNSKESLLDFCVWFSELSTPKNFDISLKAKNKGGYVFNVVESKEFNKNLLFTEFTHLRDNFYLRKKTLQQYLNEDKVVNDEDFIKEVEEVGKEIAEL